MKKILNTLTSLMLLCALALTLSVTTFAATPAAAAGTRIPIRAEEFQSSFFPEKLPANPPHQRGVSVRAALCGKQ